MNRNRIMPLIAGCITGGAALLGTVCRTVALLTHFDAEIGYFDTCFASVADTVLCFVAVIGTTVCAMLISKDNSLPQMRPARSRDIAGVLPLAAFLIFIATACANLTSLKSIRLNPNGTGLSMSTSVTVLLILAAGGTVWGLAILFGIKNRNAVGGVGFFPVLWGLLVIAVTYMDQYTAMNSPLKISIMFATLGMMAAMTADERFVLGKPAPRTYLVFTGCGVFFCLVGSIPYLIASAVGAIPEQELYPLLCYVYLFMGIFFTARLITYLHECRTASPAELETSGKEDTASCA